MNKDYYFDTAATTKVDNSVADGINNILVNEWYNPSSLYSKSGNCKKIISDSKKILADFLSARNRNEIYFTSGASESNCWAIQGFINGCHIKNKKPCIITSTIEHKSIMNCIYNMILLGVKVVFLEVDKKGFINTEELKRILSELKDEGYDVLVSIQYANNEIGTIQDIKTICNIAHYYNAIVHTDATQIFGYKKINVVKTGIDMLSASGHKIKAPKGIGILYMSDGLIGQISPLIYGTQMNGQRGGTENVPYIYGMALAVKLIQKNEYIDKVKEIQEYLIKTLEDELVCEFKVNGSTDKRLPNNVNITLDSNITGESLIYMLDCCNIYISAGSACNSLSNQPSYVLKAIGLTDAEANKTIRITLSDDMTKDDIRYFVKELNKQILIMDKS